jgi:broad specificity phosphatase PhoE
MPEIEHRRHSWRHNPGKHLTQQGVELARRVGETMGRFDLVITSDIPRAYETAIAMGYAVGRQEEVLSDLGKGVEGEIAWELGCSEFQRRAREHKRIAKSCGRQAAFLTEVAASLKPDGRALIVSHGGIIEAGVVGLLPDLDYSAWGPSCERCEGVRLRFEGDVCTGAELLRLPDGWQ